MSPWGYLCLFQMVWQEHRAQPAQGQWLQACTTVAGHIKWPLQFNELFISVFSSLSAFLPPSSSVHRAQHTCLQMMPKMLGHWFSTLAAVFVPQEKLFDPEKQLQHQSGQVWQPYSNPAKVEVNLVGVGYKGFLVCLCRQELPRDQRKAVAASMPHFYNNCWVGISSLAQSVRVPRDLGDAVPSDAGWLALPESRICVTRRLVCQIL